MATATVDGLQLDYELLGSGPPLALTPGGRFDRDIPGLRPLAELLAERFTVLLWDRPNAGRSDVHFAGPSETEMCADVLAGLLSELDLSPAVIAGGSAGARMSLQFGLRHPDQATAVAAWWVSGGPYGTFSLGSAYVVPSLEAAHRGGMDAVAALPHWAERIEANPRNAELIRGNDRDDFIAVMERWLLAYLPGVGGPVAGMRDEDIATMARPLVVVRGDPLDYNHPESVTLHIHDLVKGSTLVASPWEPGEWIRVTSAFGDGSGELFEHWPDLAPILLAQLG